MNYLFIDRSSKLNFCTAKKFWLILCGLLFSLNIFANPINIVAAENFYGTIARQIGGNKVAVQSIINNPNADPHLFSTSFATSKAISAAQIIIYNGSHYDSWMEQLLKVNKNKNTVIINVAELMQIKPDANPHIWYKPETPIILATHLANVFTKLDKPNSNIFKKNLAAFLKNNQLIQDKIVNLKNKFKNTTVTATEPVFGYMADAIGLKTYGLDFQWKIMNGTEPTPKMFIAYKNLIINKHVKLVLYNSQVISPTTTSILTLAKQNHIPVVGVTETMPTKYTSFNDWIIAELNNLETTLKLTESKSLKLNKGNK
jgi:zinc/manganese transport system substrate-binding protein